jgi:hypothetical protein
MKRALIGLMAAALAVIGFGGVGALASANGGLQAFGTGTVTIIGSDSATIDNAANSTGPFPFQYGGVYVQSKDQSGELLGAVNFSFTSTADVTGGSPRFSIPINTGGGPGSTTAYAFIDANGCNGSNGQTTVVSTRVSTCQVAFQGGGFYNYANWAEFARANPTYKIAQGHFPFIVADGAAGHYAINSIQLT